MMITVDHFYLYVSGCRIIGFQSKMHRAVYSLDLIILGVE